MRRRLACVTLLALVLSGPAAADTSVDPDRASRLLGAGMQGGVIQGATPHRMIHFTFDDGPDPRTTPELLDELDELGVKATFFFSASRFVERFKRHADVPALAREVLRRGHHVGSHSVKHVRMAKMRPPQLREQLELSDELFRKVFGSPTRLFRPPFGSRNRALDGMLHEDGYTTVMWNIGIADWVKRPPQLLARTFEKVLERNETDEGQRGGVVLLHDTHAWTVEAFHLFVEHLRQRNCEWLKTGEELYEITDSLEPFVIQDPRGELEPMAVLPPEELETRQARVRRAAAGYCK